jgi:hypothetical protein
LSGTQGRDEGTGLGELLGRLYKNAIRGDAQAMESGISWLVPGRPGRDDFMFALGEPGLRIWDNERFVIDRMKNSLYQLHIAMQEMVEKIGRLIEVRVISAAEAGFHNCWPYPHFNKLVFPKLVFESKKIFPDRIWIVAVGGNISHFSNTRSFDSSESDSF